jgi:hypothetical protein
VARRTKRIIQLRDGRLVESDEEPDEHAEQREEVRSS